ncbi:hypothetical protein IPC991_15530 [Pseudomonas aeruginosa]|nr:hypothetical protein IPC991_15530 [Pseudomonas aeruginosa]
MLLIDTVVVFGDRDAELECFRLIIMQHVSMHAQEIGHLAHMEFVLSYLLDFYKSRDLSHQGRAD